MGRQPLDQSSCRDDSTGVFIRMRHEQDHVEFAIGHYQNHPLFSLSSCAWAFQERLLSTRIVYYTATELVWECKTVVACQCGGISATSNTEIEPSFLSVRQAANYGDTNGITLKLQYHNVMQTEGESAEKKSMWEAIIFNYAFRHPSHFEDRLPALSGLAKRFQSLGFGVYFAGLWEKYLYRQLTWAVLSDQPYWNRSKTYVAPTWSWAPIKRCLTYPESVVDYDDTRLI